MFYLAVTFYCFWAALKSFSLRRETSLNLRVWPVCAWSLHWQPGLLCALQLSAACTEGQVLQAGGPWSVVFGEVLSQIFSAQVVVNQKAHAQLLIFHSCLHQGGKGLRKLKRGRNSTSLALFEWWTWLLEPPTQSTSGSMCFSWRIIYLRARRRQWWIPFLSIRRYLASISWHI